MAVDLKDKQKYLRLLWIGGIVIFIDQLTKIIITQTIALRDVIPVIPNFFNITYVLNPGGAFGILSDQSPAIRAIVFLAISSLAVVFIFYFYMSTPRSFTFLSAGLAMIFGGAVGNMIDRFRFFKVVDFLDFYINNLHWPAFNVADAAICVGMAIFIYHILFKKMPE